MLEAISGPRIAGRVSEVAHSVRDLELQADAIVLVSPHGAGGGIYGDVRGDLDAFGKPGVGVTWQRAEGLAADLEDAWDAAKLDASLDHGIVTPLALGLARGVPVVAVSVSETKDGIALADAVRMVAEGSHQRIAVVASAHLGAALTPRAPIPQRDDALALEDEILGGLQRDVGILVDRAEDLSTVGASCGVGPLAAVGHSFSGRRGDVLAYSREFGVGYLVARVDV